MYSVLLVPPFPSKTACLLRPILNLHRLTPISPFDSLLIPRSRHYATQLPCSSAYADYAPQRQYLPSPPRPAAAHTHCVGGFHESRRGGPRVVGERACVRAGFQCAACCRCWGGERYVAVLRTWKGWGVVVGCRYLLVRGSVVVWFCFCHPSPAEQTGESTWCKCKICQKNQSSKKHHIPRSIRRKNVHLVGSSKRRYACFLSCEVSTGII